MWCPSEGGAGRVHAAVHHTAADGASRDRRRLPCQRTLRRNGEIDGLRLQDRAAIGRLTAARQSRVSRAWQGEVALGSETVAGKPVPWDSAYSRVPRTFYAPEDSPAQRPTFGFQGAFPGYRKGGSARPCPRLKPGVSDARAEIWMGGAGAEAGPPDAAPSGWLAHGPADSFRGATLAAPSAVPRDAPAELDPARASGTMELAPGGRMTRHAPEVERCRWKTTVLEVIGSLPEFRTWVMAGRNSKASPAPRPTWEDGWRPCEHALFIRATSWRSVGVENSRAISWRNRFLACAACVAPWDGKRGDAGLGPPSACVTRPGRSRPSARQGASPRGTAGGTVFLVAGASRPNAQWKWNGVRSRPCRGSTPVPSASKPWRTAPVDPRRKAGDHG